MNHNRRSFLSTLLAAPLAAAGIKSNIGPAPDVAEISACYRSHSVVDLAYAESVTVTSVYRVLPSGTSVLVFHGFIDPVTWEAAK